MNMLLFKVFGLLFVLQLVNADEASQAVPPIITSAVLQADRSVKLSWTFRNFTDIDLKRYRVQASFDNWTTAIDWPAQIVRVHSFKIDDPYTSKETKSNFECFNTCVQDPKCAYAQRMVSDGVNCLLSDKVIENGTRIEHAESVSILDYMNEANIHNVPLNRLFKFRVSVYDAYLKSWSNFSASSQAVDTRIKMQLSFKRTDWQKAQVSLVNNVIEASRLVFNVYMNGTKVSQAIPESSSLGIYQPEINYVNDDYSNPMKVNTLSECQDACKNEQTCIQFIFFKEDYILQNGTAVVEKNSCFLRENVDIANGVNPRPESEAWSVHSTLATATDASHQITLLDLVIGGRYTVQIECTSNLGFTEANNQVVYDFTGLVPNIIFTSVQLSNIIMTWQMPEPLEYTRFAFFYTMNGSAVRNYVLTASTDYLDETETKSSLKNISSCFETCFNNSKCLAFTFTENMCTLKYSLSNPVACSEGITCSIIPKYRDTVSIMENFLNTHYSYQVYVQTSFGANSYLSEPNRFTFRFLTQIVQVDEFIVRRQARLRCYNNYGYIETINWYKDGRLYTSPEENNGSFEYNRSYIYFNSIRRYHSGTYACELVFRNGQHLMSNNTVYVQVIDSPPERPVVSSIMPLKLGKKQGALIQWAVDPQDLTVVCVQVSTYSKSYFDIKTEEICNDQVRFGYVTVNSTCECNTYFSISLKNAANYSSSSDFRSFDNDTCYVPSKVENYVNNNHKIFLSITILLVCITLLLMAVSTVFYCNLKKKRVSNECSDIAMQPTTFKKPLN